MLQQNAIDIDPAAAIASNVSYFNTSGVVKAEIFAATNPSSGEIAYWAQPTGSNTPSYFAPVATMGTLTLGLQSPAFAVLSGTTAPLSYSGNLYMALQVAGTADSKLTDIIGLRFFNETHPRESFSTRFPKAVIRQRVSSPAAGMRGSALASAGISRQ